jgi:hypothetical protein
MSLYLNIAADQLAANRVHPYLSRSEYQAAYGLNYRLVIRSDCLRCFFSVYDFFHCILSVIYPKLRHEDIYQDRDKFKLKFWKDYKPEFLIAALGLATYIISLVNTFHTDDWLVLNLLRDGFSWRDFLSMENMARFRPVTNIFVYLRYLAFGNWAPGYYALNIILHCFFAILLYRFLLKLGLKYQIALLSAIIFTAYFQHYEAVLWLYGTIRILGAIFWIASLWSLYNFLFSGKKSSLIAFAIFSFLGYFIVEDFVVAPLGYLLFALFISKNWNDSVTNDLTEIQVPSEFENIDQGTPAPTPAIKNAGIMPKRIVSPLIISLIGLGIYFVLRTILIIRPGVIEDYYYLGPHIFSRLAAYLGWMILPPPDHSYFQGFAARLGPALRLIWKSASLISIAALIGGSFYALSKSPRAVKFMVIFIFIALIPALPLNYKVTSRNLYIPSIGLSVLFGYIFNEPHIRLKDRRWLRGISHLFLIIFIAANIMGVWVASHEYRKNQTMVASLVTDLSASGVDLNDYNYVLLDHMPGRTVVGPAMIYLIGFKHEVIASNDPSAPGPVDIKAAAKEYAASGAPIIVFDYQNGHLHEATSEYINKP